MTSTTDRQIYGTRAERRWANASRIVGETLGLSFLLLFAGIVVMGAFKALGVL